MTSAQIQTANGLDLYHSRMHSVSHLPYDNAWRRCIEREALATLRGNVPVYNAHYADKEGYLLAASGPVMDGDYLRIKDGFFRVDKCTESAGGTVLDLDDLEGGAFCVVLANSEV